MMIGDTYVYLVVLQWLVSLGPSFDERKHLQTGCGYGSDDILQLE